MVLIFIIITDEHILFIKILFVLSFSIYIYINYFNLEKKIMLVFQIVGF